MKKFLLTIITAIASTAAINAETVVDVDQHYTGMTEFPYYQMGYAPEMKDGNMVVTNTEAKGFWEVQYFVCNPFTVTKDVEYTVTAKIKSNVSGNIVVVLGDWGNTVDKSMTVNGNNEWAEVSAKISGVTTSSSFVIFQSGDLVGTYEVEYVKVTHESDPVVLPETGNIIASFYNGNDKTLGGWGGATFENVTEDGKPCLKFTNSEKKDTWAVQMAINTDLEFNKTYYIGFDIKGDEATGISAGIQNSEDYSSKGNFTKFSITPEWKHVIIFAECQQGSGSESPANRITFDLGAYVGTFYLTDLKLYTEATSAISAVTAAPADHWTVYNLLGVKVLDTDDESQLSSLSAGFYIINGKKTLVRK